MKFKYRLGKNGFVAFGSAKLDGGISSEKKRKRKQQKLSRRLNRSK